MSIFGKKEPLILFLGDILLSIASLWLALFLRYGDDFEFGIFQEHFWPFLPIIFVWMGVFYIAGLYGKHTTIFRSRLFQTLVKAQVTNSLIAVAFFYFIPSIGLTPKINLFVYLIISLIVFFWWRWSALSLFSSKRREGAVLIGSGAEMHELLKEINDNPRYSINCTLSVDLDRLSGLDFTEEVIRRIYSEGISLVIVDLESGKAQSVLPQLYNLIFSRVRFIDMHRVYEEVFDRVPLSLIQDSWFLENISKMPRITYDVLKRAMDIVLSVILGVVSLVLYPIVHISIKLDDGGPIFITQDRVGESGRIIKNYKFRSMRVSENGGEAEITRIGSFLRKTRIDELPQLWNVLRGDLSLIGPRPELPHLVKVYEAEIPYYTVRHLVKPGLSGWAQLHHENHPHYRADVSETKVKLSYDLYYIKNRSFFLDLKIAIQTVRTLLSRSGR